MERSLVQCLLGRPTWAPCLLRPAPSTLVKPLSYRVPRYYSISSSDSNEPSPTTPESTNTHPAPSKDDKMELGLSDAEKILRELDRSHTDAAETSRVFAKTSEDNKTAEPRRKRTFASASGIVREVGESADRAVHARLQAQMDAKAKADARMRERANLMNSPAAPGSVTRKLQQGAAKAQQQHQQGKGIIDTGMKLGPTLGRQVPVDPSSNFGLTLALRKLNDKLKKNELRKQANAQRFHVRKGQVRKNLRMARWRKLFAFSFSRTVGKIKRMRDQGW